MAYSKITYKGHLPHRRFSQNFLSDENIARKIVKAFNISNSDLILEIGPGMGALTRHILKSTTNYVGIEIDKELARRLQEEYNITILEQDFLTIDFLEVKNKFPSEQKLKVVGNIPYGISSEIVFKILDNYSVVNEAILMFQKEYAERLTSKPNNRNYGIISVQSQAFAEVRKLFSVKSTSFIPRPRVDSSVVRFDMKKDVDSVIKNITLFKSLVRKAFSHRRKILKYALKEFLEYYNLSLADFSIDYSLRGEQLSVLEYINLANEIDALINVRGD
ncbi:MAG: 16S rRNA (adenine(1518)-N(6)/adenine(1519)-N(6))-dimethyltransferase RsmA [Ignavibacteria bacterium]